MNSDSFSTNVSTAMPMPSCNSKESAKKKRANRSAKLKQCKLDARREQWFSHVKKKVAMDETDTGKSRVPMLYVSHARESLEVNLEINSRCEKVKVDGSMHHYSDPESPANSPASYISSALGGNGSGTIFTGSSGSSSSSGGGGCYSRSVSDEDEEVDDECLDDWEAMADALAATDEKQDDHNVISDSDLKDKNPTSVESFPKIPIIDMSKSDPENGSSMQKGQAWRPDDAFRPQCLPNLSKQYTFPTNKERVNGCGGSFGVRKNVVLAPTCPICVEDLDPTDSSFLPCTCGYRLCLFCHKRILEDDGRCPGCRKQYNNDLPKSSLSFRLARSCSLITGP